MFGVENKEKLIKFSLIALSALFILIGVLFVVKENDYDLRFDESGTLNYEYGTDIEKNPITATIGGAVFNRKGEKVPVTVKGEWDKNKLGSYEVTFNAEHFGKKFSKKGRLVVRDTKPPKITLNGGENVIVSPVGSYSEEGFTAFDLYDGDVTANVKVAEKKNSVVYTVTDSNGNTAKKVRKIIRKDVIPPVITLNGGEKCNLQIGSQYVDAGFTAYDECDGDITASVKTEGTVDGGKIGEYTLKYTVSDLSGNVSEVFRKVTVSDYIAPVISLNGQSEIYVKKGELYIEQGARATDNIDGDITSSLVISGGVNTSKKGYYTVTYSVKDSFGNKRSVSRSVLVYEKQAISAAENPGDKVVYLTFDDGPGPHTARLLDILDKYGVKATFFVTNQFPSYQNMIGETYRRGHTVALHSYSHNYSNIYSSQENFYNDLSKLSELVKAQTGGFTANIMRFPGGTNNTVSRRCPGIMTALSRDISYHGYLYFDWNVSSGDAGGAKNSDTVYNNVVRGISSKNVSVVLQHDIKSFSVDAVDKIIFWGLNNGYTFLPITEKTPLVQFKPVN